jgi:glutamyl-tRNA synthetase
LERVSASPGTFDYAKLDWLNGVHLRALDPDAYASALIASLREQGNDWDEARVRSAAPLVQEKIGRFGEFPEFAGFLFHDVQPDPTLLDGDVLAAALLRLETADWTVEAIEVALKAASEDLGQKPKTAFLPIRVAVTGSKVSPGLYESIHLLGRDEALARMRRFARS